MDSFEVDNLDGTKMIVTDEEIVRVSVLNQDLERGAMKLSKAIQKLEALKAEHGDLDVFVARRFHSVSTLPAYAMGGGGSGWSTEYNPLLNIRLAPDGKVIQLIAHL